MSLQCGIVGLPNVGKSTLFNALTQTAAAEAANYPFCTIEPNVGDVGVPDPRLDKLAAIGKSAAILPTRLTFVDIAGLVRGASKGEGLGNQFLASIREVDAIVHVVRCFEDDDVTHVENKVDPINTIIEFMGSIGSNQQCWLQIIIRAHKKEQRKAEKLALKTAKMSLGDVAEEDAGEAKH